LTPQYHTKSGNTKTMGPLPHCPKQPLAMTSTPATGEASKAANTLAAPCFLQVRFWHTRTHLPDFGADSGVSVACGGEEKVSTIGWDAEAFGTGKHLLDNHRTTSE
jgi:hypothetical protein